jgi:hypothetical protein
MWEESDLLDKMERDSCWVVEGSHFLPIRIPSFHLKAKRSPDVETRRCNQINAMGFVRATSSSARGSCPVWNHVKITYECSLWNRFWLRKVLNNPLVTVRDFTLSEWRSGCLVRPASLSGVESPCGFTTMCSVQAWTVFSSSCTLHWRARWFIFSFTLCIVMECYQHISEDG